MYIHIPLNNFYQFFDKNRNLFIVQLQDILMTGVVFKCDHEGCDYQTEKIGYLKLHLIKGHGLTNSMADSAVRDAMQAAELEQPQQTDDVQTPTTSPLPAPTPQDYGRMHPSVQKFNEALDDQLEIAQKTLVLERFNAMIREARGTPTQANLAGFDVNKVLQQFSAVLTEKVNAEADIAAAEIEGQPQPDMLTNVITSLMQNPDTINALVKQFADIAGNLFKQLPSRE